MLTFARKLILEKLLGYIAERNSIENDTGTSYRSSSKLDFLQLAPY